MGYDPCCSNFRAAVNNPACVNQCPGLAGDCCPTPGGMYLGCCKNKKKGEDAEDSEWLSQGEDAETTPQVTDELLLTVGAAFFVVFSIGVAVGLRFKRGANEPAEYRQIS